MPAALVVEVATEGSRSPRRRVIVKEKVAFVNAKIKKQTPVAARLTTEHIRLAC